MGQENDSISSSHFPYEECLLPNLPEIIQHQMRDVTNHVIIPLDTLLAVMSFVCNTFVFITVARTKSLQHPSLLMLCSLSISDLIWALFTFTENIFIFLDPHMCPEQGYEEASLAMLCFLATLSNLTIISRDRYLAICRPNWYQHHANRSRAIKATAFSWITSIVTALSAYTIFKIRSSKNYVVFMIIFLFYTVCTLMILFSYVKFFIANKRNSRNMQIQARSRRAEREKKLTKVVSMIVLCFLFTFLPALISPLILVSMGIRHMDPFAPFFSLLMTLNGLLNPLLNYSRNADMRRAVHNMLTCYRRTRSLPAAIGNIAVPAGNNISTAQPRNMPLQELHF